MDVIIEQLLDIAVQKLKNFEAGDCTNKDELQVAKTILSDAYDVYQTEPEAWEERRKAIIAECGSEYLHGLCLMFELTVLGAKTLAATRLIQEGFDPKADKSIVLLDHSLKFGCSFSDMMGRSIILTMETEVA